MTLIITEPALAWMKKELNLHAGDAVRFFARYGGCGNVQAGFSLGLQKEKPTEIGIEYKANDITFFMEKDDVWYLDEGDLLVDYDATQDEIQYFVTAIH